MYKRSRIILALIIIFFPETLTALQLRVILYILYSRGTAQKKETTDILFETAQPLPLTARL